MELIRGMVVRSKAGRDGDSFLVVLEVLDGFVLVADGKQRPIEHPKRKSIKHIAITQQLVTEEQLQTNRSIRHVLSDFKSHTCEGEI